MSDFETLHMQLQEVLKTEAAAAMAAYEQGIHITQQKLQTCLVELHKAQAAAEQQHQMRVQQIQQEYQQDLEHLTQQYEEQVRHLEQTTRQRVTEAQTEAEESITQAAAQLLHTLQQQQKAAAEAAALVHWNALPEPTLLDIHQLQQQPVLQQPHAQQHAGRVQLQQHGEISHHLQQQQLHREQEWMQELQQHRHSWRQLEAEELLLHEPRSISRPGTPRELHGPPARAATYAAGQHAVGSGGNRWEQHEMSTPSGHQATAVGHAGSSCISAPASLSVSRTSSRTRDSAADGQWQDSSRLQTASTMLQPPPQLLRALSATEVLRRASGSRQQLQQGLLEGLRRASEASSDRSREEMNRDRKDRAQLTRPDTSKQLPTGTVQAGNWEGLWSGERRVSMAEILPPRHSSRAADEIVLEKQQHLLRQSYSSEGATPWRLSSVGSREPALIASNSPQRPVLMGHKPTKALGLLDTDSD